MKASVIACHCRKDSLRKHRGTLRIRVEVVRKQVRSVFKGGIKIDQCGTGEGSDLLNHLLYLPVPVAGSCLEPPVTVEYWREPGNIKFRCTYRPERVNQPEVITDEFITKIRPCSWIGIIQAKVEDGNIRAECKGCPELLCPVVWSESFLQ